MTLLSPLMRRRLGCLALALCAGALAAPAGAAAWNTEATVAEGLGIAAHRPSADDLDGIAGVGASIVRTDLSWGRTEKTAGVYDFGPYLEMAREMRARGLTPMFILDYGNALYSPMVDVARRNGVETRAAAPATPEAIAAYAAWSVAAVKAFAEFDPIWEIWNEPDLTPFWPPKSDPVAYGRLAAQTCRAMRAASPRPLTILGPAAAKWIDTDFVAQVVAGEAATCFDAISVHPYQITATGDEDAPKWEGLRRTIDTAQPGRALPIANSEWGKSEINRVTEEKQAAYMVRSLTVNQAAGVRFNVWYVWKDPGDEPDNDQHRFGIQRYDGSFRLIQTAMKTLTARIGASRFRCVVHDGGLTQALFSGPEAWTLVVWSQDGDRVWSPPPELSVTGAVSMTGEAIDAERVALTDRIPVYLTIDPASSSPPCVE